MLWRCQHVLPMRVCGGLYGCPLEWSFLPGGHVFCTALRTDVLHARHVNRRLLGRKVRHRTWTMESRTESCQGEGKAKSLPFPFGLLAVRFLPRFLLTLHPGVLFAFLR